MKKIMVWGLCALSGALAAAPLAVTSPDGRLAVSFEAGERGLTWSLARDGRALVTPSALGLRFANAAPLGAMKVLAARRDARDETWQTRLYRRGTVRNRYNELAVDLEECAANAVRVGLGQTQAVKLPRRLTLVFRCFDEGAAFRYEIPEQPAFDGFEIKEELTEWRFAGDVPAWTTTYARDGGGEEEPFVRGPLGAIAPERFIGMPAIVETPAARVALCEAALVNWAGLFYHARKDAAGNAFLTAALAKLPDTPAAESGIAVIAATPAKSSWRVMLVGNDELDLLRKNDVIVNLNPPPDPSLDFSWVKPGATTWDWWTESNNSLSTELAIRLVDFAAEMGWPYHTIDGGWYGFARRPNHGPNVPLRPRKDFDLARVVAHARAKGVGVWVWIHWMEIEDTGIEETFARLEKWGVAGVKTDFLNRADQWIVNWYERAARAAARHHILINFHGAFRPTGTERTWPNNLTREGVLGNEMNIFNRRITPEHCATLPFTRFLLGPGDFTPGSFANVYSAQFTPQVKKGHRYGDETDRCEHWAEERGTRAHAIAQCIAFDSYLTTLCDWPERYRGAPGLEALRALPTTWKATTPVAGRCGEHYAVVRETHDGRFYFAAFTVKRRVTDLKLDFLPEGDWTMQVYADDPEYTPGDATMIKCARRTVRRGQSVSFPLLDEGGAVAVFTRQ